VEARDGKQTDMSPERFDIIPAASFPSIDLMMIPPGPSLARWVQCMWVALKPPHAQSVIAEKLYPDGGTSLTFVIDNTGASARFFHHNQVTTYHWNMSKHHISIRFRPGGATALLGLDISDIHNMETDLLELPFPHLADLTRLLDTLPVLSVTERLSAIQHWLSELTYRAHLPERKWSALLAYASANLVPPQQAANLKGVSRRTLERQLRKQFGHSPNQLHSYAQIRHARQRLMNTSDRLSDIALDCGYFDQSHFSNAFREQTLETPSEYRQRKLSQISNP